MESKKVNSISDNLRRYDYLAKKDDFIIITEWYNSEGYTITINDKVIDLSIGQLDAINYLVKSLEYNEDKG